MDATTPPLAPPEKEARDETWFRHVLGRHPTGVCVVSAMAPAGDPVALVVGSFASASLDPPLVSFLPARASERWELLRAVGRFCVSILAEDQEALCRRIAEPGRGRLDGIAWSPSPRGGGPVLDGACAYVDCILEAVHPAGDHDFALCRALDLGVLRDAKPLVFLGGAYGGFSPAG